jgi:hypothetical protein
MHTRLSLSYYRTPSLPCVSTCGTVITPAKARAHTCLTYIHINHKAITFIYLRAALLELLHNLAPEQISD